MLGFRTRFPIMKPDTRPNRSLFRITGQSLAALALGSLIPFVPPAQAADFTADNLIVERMGDGTAALGSGATAVSLVEYSPTGTEAQVINLPTTGADRLTDAGSSTSNGYLGSQGAYLAVPGYNVDAGTASVANANSKVTSIFGVNGSVTTRTLHPADATIFGGSNYRSAWPVDSNKFYAAGTGSTTTGGVWYYDGSAFSQLLSGNIRIVGIYAGQLYYSTGSGTQGIYKVGTGTPTSTAAPSLFQASTSPYGFVIFDTDNDTQPDILFIADDGTGAAAGLRRFDWNSGSSIWVETYSRRLVAATGLLTTATSSVISVRGLTGSYSGGTATLYATTTETSNNRLVKIVDDGTTTPTTFTTLAQAGANRAFRGVAFAPVSANAPPNIGTEPLSQTIQSGTTAGLVVAASGTEPFTFQWYQGASGDTSTPVGTNSPNFVTPSLTMTTSYWVRVTNAHGSDDSATAVITVTTLPVVLSTVPANAAANVPVDAVITVNFSKSVNLSASAITVVDAMSNPVAFTGLPIEGVESVEITPVDDLAYNETYTVTVVAAQVEDEDMNAMAENHVFTFTTEPMVAPAFTTHPAATTNIASGGQATLNVVATGKPAPSIQWYQGATGDTSTPLSGENGTSFTTPALTASTQYWARATNPLSSASSNTANVNVVSPDLVVELSAPGSVGVGENITFTLRARNTGLVSATNVSVVFYLPSGLAYLSDDPGAGNGFTSSYPPGAVQFAGGMLGANETAVLTVTASHSGAGIYTLPAGSAVIDPASIVSESNETNNDSAEISTSVLAVLGSTPVPGDVIFNEYMSDNDSNGNDFIELLVLTDGVDLRGLRISDNELITSSGVQTLNTNEAVYVLGTDPYLANVPAGVTIAIWALATGVTTDTVADPFASDWSMTLCPGTGVTATTDGLGGSLNLGLAAGGEALYLYLPGPDGSSAGDDNIYLDFVSFESDGGEAPAGLVDINLPSIADNAYYTGNTAAGNDLAANWTRYDGAPNASTTAGEANPGQDLSGLRIVPTAGSIAFVSATFTVNQGDLVANISLERTGGTLPTSVTLSTADGMASISPPFSPALAGTDYEALTTLVEFALDETVKVVPVTLTPRSGTKIPNLQFDAALSAPAGGATLGATDTASVRILTADVTAPKITVKTPAAPRAPATSLVTSVQWPYQLSGTAGDALGIDRVEITVNGGAPILATLGASSKPTSVPFTAAIEPDEGINTVVFTAYDLKGNSTSLTRVIDFSRRYELALARTLSGSPDTSAGSIALYATPKADATAPAPKYDAAQTLSVLPGTSILLQAKPLSGFVFSHWSGAPAGAMIHGDRLSFVMPASNVPAITAHFLPNPFLGLGDKPVFYGLLTPESGTALGNTTFGFLTGALTTGKGGFSGKILLDGKTTGFAAVVFGNGSVWFNVAGALLDTLVFDGGKELSLTFASGKLEAVLVNGSDGSSGDIFPAIYSKTSTLAGSPLLNRPAKAGDPVNQGYYTVVLESKAQTPPRDSDTYPQGDGYTSLTLAVDGTFKFAGVLADKTKVTGASALVAGHTSPVFAQLLTPGAATKNATFGGVLAFDTAPADTDVSGQDLVWIRPAVTETATLATQLYTDGWPEGITVDAFGALFATSDIESSLGLGSPSPIGNSSFVFSGGKLAANLEKVVNIAVNTTTPAITGDKSIKAMISAKTGIFTGAFTPNWLPLDTKQPAHAGILLLKGANKGGYGHFISNIPGDTNPASGAVSLGVPLHTLP